MSTVIVVLELDDTYVKDPQDLIDSIRARVEDEAGYLDDGRPISPEAVSVIVYPAGLDEDTLETLYSYGIQVQS